MHIVGIVIKSCKQLLSVVSENKTTFFSFYPLPPHKLCLKTPTIFHTPQTPVVAISPNLFILKTSFVQYTHTDVHEAAYHAVLNPLLYVTSIARKCIFLCRDKQRHDMQQYNRGCAFSRGLDGRQISPKQTYHGDEGGE